MMPPRSSSGRFTPEERSSHVLHQAHRRRRACCRCSPWPPTRVRATTTIATTITTIITRPSLTHDGPGREAGRALTARRRARASSAAGRCPAPPPVRSRNSVSASALPPRDSIVSRKWSPFWRVRPPCAEHPLGGVGGEHLAPDVRVVAGRIAARERVREVGAAIARRHRREVQRRRGAAPRPRTS